MTISDVTMNDTGPLYEALRAESISARAMSLLQIERICNHAQKPSKILSHDSSGRPTHALKLFPCNTHQAKSGDGLTQFL